MRTFLDENGPRKLSPIVENVSDEGIMFLNSRFSQYNSKTSLETGFKTENDPTEPNDDDGRFSEPLLCLCVKICMNVFQINNRCGEKEARNSTAVLKQKRERGERE